LKLERVTRFELVASTLARLTDHLATRDNTILLMRDDKKSGF
jgi:hypothetical protein